MNVRVAGASCQRQQISSSETVHKRSIAQTIDAANSIGDEETLASLFSSSALFLLVAHLL